MEMGGLEQEALRGVLKRIPSVRERPHLRREIGRSANWQRGARYTHLSMAKLGTADRKAYYLAALVQHRQLLKSSIEQMAEGNLVHALTIATSIRALLHETGQSIPLLKRLRSDYLSLPIFTAATPKPQPTPPNVRAVTVMYVAANLMIAGGKLSLNPAVSVGSCEQKTLGAWWTDMGLVVPGGTPLSRKDIILGIANKEGAHVDDDMPRNYRIMLQSKSLQIKINDTEFEAVNITKYVCGTAGVELLECLERIFSISEPSLPGGSVGADG